MPKPYYQIEDVAAKTGLTKRALRYYEDIELINPIRTEAGYRLYTDEDVARALRIIEIKEVLGFSLNDIKSIMGLESILKDILSGKTKDPQIIEDSIKGVREHLNKVRNKQEMLARNITKSEEVLNRLNSIYEGLKE